MITAIVLVIVMVITIIIIIIIIIVIVIVIRSVFIILKSQNFKLSFSNPKNKYVACVSVLSQISNWQSLGGKSKHESLKTDRTITVTTTITITITFTIATPTSIKHIIFFKSWESLKTDRNDPSPGTGRRWGSAIYYNIVWYTIIYYYLLEYTITYYNII